MSSQTLVLPADLAAVCFTVFLGVAFCGLDRGSRIAEIYVRKKFQEVRESEYEGLCLHEEDGSHTERGEGGGDFLEGRGLVMI